MTNKFSHIIKKAALKAVVLLTVINFLWSGLAINLAQLLNYCLIRPLNFTAFSRINYYLIYSSWSQIVALFDWFFGANLQVYHKDKRIAKDMFDNHCVFLANHSYELDWIGAWLIAEKFGHLASCKAMLKSDLAYIPVVGWTWSLSDQILLDRNWEKDKHKFASAVDKLLRYEPMVVTFFCEGARCTNEKLEACQKFAAERSLVAPKYHLIPRTKGWCAFVKLARQQRQLQAERQAQKSSKNGSDKAAASKVQLNNNNNDDNNNNTGIDKPKIWIYNAQISYDERGALSIGDVIAKGLQPQAHLYFDRYDIDEIPHDDEGAAKWLQDLYLSKDKLQAHFNTHHEFPGHKDPKFGKSYKPRLRSLLNWLFWAAYTLICASYVIMKLYAACGFVIVFVILLSCFVLSYAYLTFIVFQQDVGDSKTKSQASIAAMKK